MGAWGYEPFENDNAMDWRHKAILVPIQKTIRSKHSGAEETLAALQVLIDLDCLHLFDEAELSAAFERVEAEDAHSKWRDPVQRKKVLRRIKRKIKL